MSALLSIGEADHSILNSSSELAHAASLLPADARDPRAALAAAQVQLVHARALLAALRLALRAHGIADALAYHEAMAARLREAAKAARMPPGRGLYLQADQHEVRARALRVIVGTDAPLTAHVSDRGERSGS